MPLDAIINAAASQADDYLQGVRTPAEAKSVIAEWLAEHHPKLPAVDRQKALLGILAILNGEGFFEGAGANDPWSDATNGAEEA